MTGRVVSFTGEAAVDVYACLTVVSGLRFYAETRMKVNRAYTPSNMLAFVERHVGKKYPRSPNGMLEAASALEDYARRKGEQEAKKGNIG